MKKSRIKSIIALILVGTLYFTCAVGSSSDTTTTSTDDSKDKTEAKTTEASKAEEYKLNQDIYITNSSGEYRIKFTGVKETSDRNQFADVEADRVIIIDYEYENISLEDDLYISELDFGLYDKDNNKMETYPSTETKAAAAVATGRKTTASVAYALNNSENYVELEFYDNMFNGKSDCKVILEW